MLTTTLNTKPGVLLHVNGSSLGSKKLRLVDFTAFHVSHAPKS